MVTVSVLPIRISQAHESSRMLTGRRLQSAEFMQQDFMQVHSRWLRMPGDILLGLGERYSSDLYLRIQFGLLVSEGKSAKSHPPLYLYEGYLSFSSPRSIM